MMGVTGPLWGRWEDSWLMGETAQPNVLSTLKTGVTAEVFFFILSPMRCHFYAVQLKWRHQKILKNPPIGLEIQPTNICLFLLKAHNDWSGHIPTGYKPFRLQLFMMDLHGFRSALQLNFWRHVKYLLVELQVGPFSSYFLRLSPKQSVPSGRRTKKKEEKRWHRLRAETWFSWRLSAARGGGRRRDGREGGKKRWSQWTRREIFERRTKQERRGGRGRREKEKKKKAIGGRMRTHVCAGMTCRRCCLLLSCVLSSPPPPPPFISI